MIRSIIALFVVAIIATTGLSLYLQPDDLVNCEDAPSSELNCQKVDAIIAISGGDTKARTSQAIDLYKKGWSDLIIFSGAAQDKTGPSNAKVMSKLALDAGIPGSAIVIDEDAETTKQNAQNSQKIFVGKKIKTVILVTSGYHQKRASLEFEKYTTDATIYNHPVLSDKDWSFWWWMTPRGWWLAVGEAAKILLFYVFGM